MHFCYDDVDKGKDQDQVQDLILGFPCHDELALDVGFCEDQGKGELVLREVKCTSGRQLPLKQGLGRC